MQQIAISFTTYKRGISIIQSPTFNLHIWTVKTLAAQPTSHSTKDHSL